MPRLIHTPSCGRMSAANATARPNNIQRRSLSERSVARTNVNITMETLKADQR